MKASKFIKNVAKFIVSVVISLAIFILWLFVDEWIHDSENKFHILGVFIYCLVGILGIIVTTIPLYKIYLKK